MLSEADNQLLCRVGPGTLVGDLLRRYWIPALRSDEIPEADSAPIRVRLLGENLIGFRATSGEVGQIQDACPHRGVSLFFGCNEEEGLRCVYRHEEAFTQAVEGTSSSAESLLNSMQARIAAEAP